MSSLPSLRMVIFVGPVYRQPAGFGAVDVGSVSFFKAELLGGISNLIGPVGAETANSGLCAVFESHPDALFHRLVPVMIGELVVTLPLNHGPYVPAGTPVPVPTHINIVSLEWAGPSMTSPDAN